MLLHVWVFVVRRYFVCYFTNGGSLCVGTFMPCVFVCACMGVRELWVFGEC